MKQLRDQAGKAGGCRGFDERDRKIGTLHAKIGQLIMKTLSQGRRWTPAPSSNPGFAFTTMETACRWPSGEMASSDPPRVCGYNASPAKKRRKRFHVTYPQAQPQQPRVHNDSGNKERRRFDLSNRELVIPTLMSLGDMAVSL